MSYHESPSALMGRTVLVAVIALVFSVTAEAQFSSGCAGDCDANGGVSISECILLVGIACGECSIVRGATCGSGMLCVHAEE